jgi:hypothetical protein
LIGVLLLVLWIWDRPHQYLSYTIGRLFPWPSWRSLKWPALLLERATVEALTCLPVAFILARVMRAWAIGLAIVLAAIEVLIVLPQLRSYPPGSHQWRFLLFFAAIHFVFLVGGTTYLRRLRKQRGST